ncbi:sterile alpha motif domain-containing protein 1-like [Anomalospiza imberbis]|uniref:sterile alpha motif domain-containing protein 1-like n=1 Tax=Anomalospiza imberbis TaxID=187417 RepID=UPI00358E1A70
MGWNNTDPSKLLREEAGGCQEPWKDGRKGGKAGGRLAARRERERSPCAAGSTERGSPQRAALQRGSSTRNKTQRREDAAASCGPPRRAVAPFSRELCLSKFAPSVPKHTTQETPTFPAVPTAPRGSAGHLPAPPARSPAAGQAGPGTSRLRPELLRQRGPRSGRAGQERGGGSSLRARSKPAPSPLPPPAKPAALPPPSPANSRRCPAAVLSPFPRLSQRWEKGGTRSGSAVSPSAPPAQRCPAGGAGGAEGAAGTEGTKAAAAAGNKEPQETFSGLGTFGVTGDRQK